MNQRDIFSVEISLRSPLLILQLKLKFIEDLI